MKLPLILCESGDITLYECVEELEQYVESPDLGAYRVFDASGNVLKLTTSEPVSAKNRWFGLVRILPVRVELPEPEINAENELKDHLRSFILRVTGQSYEQSELPELIDVLKV